MTDYSDFKLTPFWGVAIIRIKNKTHMNMGVSQTNNSVLVGCFPGKPVSLVLLLHLSTLPGQALSPQIIMGLKN